MSVTVYNPDGDIITVIHADAPTGATGATGSTGTTGATLPSGSTGATAPPPPGTQIFVLGNDFGHEHQRWMADVVDSAKLAAARAAAAAETWELPAVVEPLNGATPTRLRVWNTYGERIDLYSQIPDYFDANGLSAPWSPQKGDKFNEIVADLLARPLPSGVRGRAIVSPYITAMDHPYEVDDGTGNMVPIPRAPTWVGCRHDAMIQFYYGDGTQPEAVHDAGKLNGVSCVHDICVSENDRTTMYACSLDKFDSTGKCTSASLKIIDRKPGMVSPTQPIDDATKYIVTDYMAPGTLVYPTACCTDNAKEVNVARDRVYVVDYGAGGKIYRDGVLWLTIPNAFGMRYDAGKVYVLTSTISVFAVDCQTGVPGPDLFAQNQPPFLPGSLFCTISIDRTGAFGEKGQIAVTRSAGGSPYALLRDSTGIKTWASKYGVGLGNRRVGDLTYSKEWLGHYLWMLNFHRWQARIFCAGLASPPHEVVAYADKFAVPVEESSAAFHGHTCAALAQQVIRKGGSLASPFDKPSMTCFVSRDGASGFPGCSYGAMAKRPFDETEAFMRGGMLGAFRRDDWTPAEMFAVMVDIYQTSMEYLKRGAPLMAELETWWIGKYGSIPTIPPAVAYTPAPALRLKPTWVGSVWRIVVMNEDGYDTTQAPPAGAYMLADEGLPQQVTLPAQVTTLPLAPGQHALTGKAPGWASQAVVVSV